nr:hypothetical protein [Mycobacterium sp. UM_NZ2]
MAQPANVRRAVFVSVAVAATVFTVGAMAAIFLGYRGADSAVSSSRVNVATPNKLPYQPNEPSVQPVPAQPVPAPPESGLRWAFQTPTGNIGCLLDGTVTPATVSCVIREHTYEAQESLSPVCAPASPLRFEMTEGQSPSVGCVARSEGFGLPVQDYGQPISAGSIRCVSDIVTGVTCTDRRSGHFFQVAREAFTAG